MLDPQAATGESARLVARALQLAPNHRKALSLAGTLAFDREDYRGAIGYWERQSRLDPRDGSAGRRLQARILQARELASLQGPAAPVSAIERALAPAFDTSVRNRLSGVVTIAPSLADRAAPDDTVLVYARTAIGPRPPQILMRRQVKDLPLRFSLDDPLAAAPVGRHGNAQARRVIVGARIARGDDTGEIRGGLQGQTPPVALGRSDLTVVIDEVVRLR